MEKKRRESPWRETTIRSSISSFPFLSHTQPSGLHRAN